MHELNQPVTTENTHIVEIDGQSTDVPVTVTFRLAPYPTVVLEADELPGQVLSKERFKVALANGARLETMLRSFNPGTHKGSLIPARQPVTVIDNGVPLREVDFCVLNLPVVYGNQMKRSTDEGTSTAVPHIRIEASGWCVEMSGVQDIRNVVTILKRERGYGVTYKGRITRSATAGFTVEAVKPLLTALRTFLSFARGAWCSLALVRGKDQSGRQSWVRWGTHHVARWTNQRSWFGHHGGDDILSDLFPKFWRLFESDDEWQETIRRTIDWYLLSNESATHVGVILTQAALERLSHQILGRGKEGKEPAGAFIRKALEELHLELDIPSSCGGLKDLQQTCDWDDSLHALVAMRNDLVHPTAKLGDVSHYAHYEAWNLGQWYIEIVLLKELGYQGKYMNRLASPYNDLVPFEPVLELPRFHGRLVSGVDGV